ncbi:MBL fold metallo-hydrolase [candidate division KSB1 bacterium]
MSLSITFLGTGGSSGVPEIGCACAVCTSSDPRNKRTRSSICIHKDDRNIVIDSPPEFRLQMITHGIQRLDALIFTHAHADHIMGLADVRPFNFAQRSSINIYGNEKTLECIKKSFSFIFNAPEELKRYYPRLNPQVINGRFSIDGLIFQPITVYHARLPVLAFRFENSAYVTDVNSIPEESFTYLEDLDLLILEAFRFEKHISHFTLDEAVETARRIGARKTLFTHISHSLDHEKVNDHLPDGMSLAYDGLTVTP